MENPLEWVSCSERLPEPGVPVITAIYGSDLIVPLPGESLAEAVDRIFSAPGHTSISFIGEDGLWCDGFFGGPEIVAPSYWMEFPAPPPNPHVAKRKENAEFAATMDQMFSDVLGDATMEEKAEGGYHPVQLLAAWPMDALPQTEEDFLAPFKEDEEGEE